MTWQLQHLGEFLRTDIVKMRACSTVQKQVLNNNLSLPHGTLIAECYTSLGKGKYLGNVLCRYTRLFLRILISTPTNQKAKPQIHAAAEGLCVHSRVSSRCVPAAGYIYAIWYDPVQTLACQLA